MKKHYYFTQGIIKYKDVEGEEVTDFKEVTYELTQEKVDEESDRIFFLGVPFQLYMELKKSFLSSRPYIKENQIISINVTLVSRLN